MLYATLDLLAAGVGAATMTVILIIARQIFVLPRSHFEEVEHPVVKEKVEPSPTHAATSLSAPMIVIITIGILAVVSAVWFMLFGPS